MLFKTLLSAAIASLAIAESNGHRKHEHGYGKQPKERTVDIKTLGKWYEFPFYGRDETSPISFEFKVPSELGVDYILQVTDLYCVGDRFNVDVKNYADKIYTTTSFETSMPFRFDDCRTSTTNERAAIKTDELWSNGEMRLDAGKNRIFITPSISPEHGGAGAIRVITRVPGPGL